MYKVEVLKMLPEHIDGVLVVENLSFKIPWSRNAFIEEVTNNKFARYIVAVVDGNVVGYAGMWKVFDEGHITNIAVHSEFRSNGVGSILLEKLLDISREEGITKLTLEVRKSNIVAQKLYAKFGFESGGVRKAYYADNNEDAIIMWKNSIL